MEGVSRPWMIFFNFEPFNALFYPFFCIVRARDIYTGHYTGKNLMEDSENICKNREELEGGGEFCWLARIYTPGQSKAPFIHKTVEDI